MAPWSVVSGGSSSRQPGWQLPFVEEGRTPVGIAAAKGDLDALEECVQLQRMDPNEFDTYKETPLHLAVIYGRTEAVKLLVMDLGAKVDLPNWEGATPLCYAVAHGHLEIAKFLVKSKANINHSSQHGLRPLHFAAMYGSTEGVAWLLDRGANPMKTTQFMTVARDMTRPGPSRRMLHRAMDGMNSEMPSAR